VPTIFNKTNVAKKNLKFLELIHEIVFRINHAWFWGEVEEKPGLIPATHVHILRGSM